MFAFVRLILLVTVVVAINQQCSQQQSTLFFQASSQTQKPEVQSSQISSQISAQFDKKSQKSSICPQNSFCNQNSYCQCSPNFILNCSTYSPILTSTSQQFILQSSSPSYFTIVPSSSDAMYVYRFTFCISQNAFSTAKINLTLFADEGVQQELKDDNLIGSIGLGIQGADCLPLFSPYMEFGVQPNGQIQQMVLKVGVIQIGNFVQGVKGATEGDQSQIEVTQIIKGLREMVEKEKQKIKQKELNSTKIQIELNQNININTNIKDTSKLQITLKVQQIYVLKLSTLWAIIISILSFLLLSFIGGIIYCIKTIRRSQNPQSLLRFTDNNLSHFEQLMPKQKVKAHSKYLAMTCPVCLLDFVQGDQIRSTFCGHTFHSECLDQWCKKNISCPVCRSGLDKGSVSEGREIMMGGIVNNGIQEEQIEEELQTTEKSRGNMRTSLIQ